jgi:CII-binding regulator of phage lambda lysogenization HflD
MAMTPTLKQLQEMSDDDIIETYNSTSKNTAVGLQFFLDELNRRSQNRQSNEMLRMTRQVTFMTVITTIATVINLVVAYLTLK